MKFSIKFSWSLIIHIVNALLIIALIFSFWLNYSWLQKVQQSIESKNITTPAGVDNKLYEQVLEKIDAKQKIPVPKAEEIRNIMIQAASNTNTPVK